MLKRSKHGQHEEHGPHHQPKRNLGARRFRNRGVDVEIVESEDAVSLTLDGQPVEIAFHDGQYHSQLANQFEAFDSVDDVVDTLLANEGRTWTLHGHICDERCGPGGHDHGPGGHDHGAHQ